MEKNSEYKFFMLITYKYLNYKKKGKYYFFYSSYVYYNGIFLNNKNNEKYIHRTYNLLCKYSYIYFIS